MTTEEREQLLNEIDRLRRFNNKLAEAARGRFVMCEVDTSAPGIMGFHVIVAPDCPDETAAMAIASRIAAAIVTTVDSVHTVGHRDQPTPEKD